MASINIVKTINRRNPTVIDKLNAFMFGGRVITEYDENVSYIIDDIVYRIVGEDVLFYIAVENTTGGPFDSLAWTQISMFDFIGGSGSGGVLVSDRAPTSSTISTWFKPIRHITANLEDIVCEMFIDRLTYEKTGNYMTITGLGPLKGYRTEHFFGPTSTPKTLDGVVVNKIGDNAFKDVIGITDLYITDNIIEIGSGAFKPSTNSNPERGYYLSSIDFGYGLSVIKSTSFANQAYITELTFPGTIEEIEANAFDGCKLLNKITIYNRDTVINSTAFSNCPALKDVYGLSGSTAEEFATAKGYTFHEI